MTDTNTVAPPKPPQPPPPAGVQGPAPPEPPRQSGTAAVTWGVILIAVGLVLLAERFVPVFSAWNLWPLIIIIAGVVQAVTPGKDGWSISKLFDGLVTVAFGGVFLAITTGVVGWDVWARIITLWPVLIIALGLELLSKALGASWPKILGSLAIIAALAYSVAVTAADLDGVVLLRSPPGGTPYELSESDAGVEQANLKLDAGVARVRMSAGDDLVSLRGTSPFGEPELRVERSGSLADVDVSLQRGPVSMVWPGDFTADYAVRFSRDVLWDLKVDVGVTALDADLSELDVARLELKPGVASCDVKLGGVPAGRTESRAMVEAGVSSVRVRLPSRVAARVEIESGLSGSTVRGGFSPAGKGVWETEDYDAARAAGTPVWVVNVKSGIGSVTIDTY